LQLSPEYSTGEVPTLLREVTQSTANEVSFDEAHLFESIKYCINRILGTFLT
jgi:hypothetical protein